MQYLLKYCTKYMEVATTPLPLDFDGVPYPGEGSTPKFFTSK